MSTNGANGAPPDEPVVAITPASKLPVRALLQVMAADRRTVLGSHRLDFATGRLRVGRSLRCEVVVDDPHLAAEHFELGFDAEGHLRIRDLGTINGIEVDHVARSELVVDDARLHLIDAGATHFQLRVQPQELAAEVPLARTRRRRRPVTTAPAWQGGFRSSHFWMLLLAMLAVMSYAYWVDATWRRDVLSTIVSGSFGMLVMLGGWVGFWALVSRVVIGQPCWTVHACLAVGTLLVSMLGSEALRVSSFALARVLPEWLLQLWIGLCAMALLHAHLRVATRLRVSRIVAMAAAVPLGVSVVLGWQALNSVRGYERLHATLTPMYPPAMRLVSPAAPEDFLVQARGLELRAVERMKAFEDRDEADAAEDAKGGD